MGRNPKKRKDQTLRAVLEFLIWTRHRCRDLRVAKATQPYIELCMRSLGKYDQIGPYGRDEICKRTAWDDEKIAKEFGVGSIGLEFLKTMRKVRL